MSEDVLHLETVRIMKLKLSAASGILVYSVFGIK